MATTPESLLLDFTLRPEQPVGVPGYHSLLGVLFAMASAPEVLTPPDWVPLVSGSWGFEYVTDEEAAKLTDAAMAIYTAIDADIARDRVKLPRECGFRVPAEANLAGDAPMAQWCQGFRVGHQWLEARWKKRLLPQFWEQYEAFLITLSFFESPKLAKDLCRTTNSDLPETARAVVEIFEVAMAAYAQLGRTLRQLPTTVPFREPQMRGGSKVGRNEQCPCGSGRKYKKCCGAAA